MKEIKCALCAEDIGVIGSRPAHEYLQVEAYCNECDAITEVTAPPSAYFENKH